jgi:hypothetical protein
MIPACSIALSVQIPPVVTHVAPIGGDVAAVVPHIVAIPGNLALVLPHLSCLTSFHVFAEIPSIGVEIAHVASGVVFVAHDVAVVASEIAHFLPSRRSIRGLRLCHPRPRHRHHRSEHCCEHCCCHAFHNEPPLLFVRVYLRCTAFNDAALTPDDARERTVLMRNCDDASVA